MAWPNTSAAGWGVAGTGATGWGSPVRKQAIGQPPPQTGGAAGFFGDPTVYGAPNTSGAGWGVAGSSNPSTPTSFKPSQIRSAVPPTPNTAGSVDATQTGFMNNPGTGEQWWANNQDQINKNGQLSPFLQASAGRLFGMNYQPDNLSGAYRNMTNTLGSGPQAGTVNARGVADTLRNPSAGEGMQQDAAGMFQGPNLSHAYAQDTAGFFGDPTMSAGYAGAMVPGLTGMGPGEQNAYGMMDAGYGLGNRSDAVFQNVLAPNANANVVGGESNNFLPGLRDLSDSEKLYNSGNTGLDSAYQREADKQARALTNRMAATGSFGNGATARALSEQGADLGAAQAHDMASLAGQADQARLGRTDAARMFSTAAGQEGIQRGDLTLRGATAADDSARQNVDRMFAGGQLGLGADAQGINRTKLGGDLVNNADQNALAKTLGGSQVATAGDTSLINQGTALANTGHALAGDTTNRLNTSASTGLAADAEDRERVNDIVAGSKSLDEARQKAAQMGLDIEKYLGTMTGAADQQDWQRTQDRFANANTTQNMFQGRFQTQFDNTLAAGKAQAGVYGDQSGKMSDEDVKLATDQINNMVAQGALTQQQGQQLLEELVGVGKTAAALA